MGPNESKVIEFSIGDVAKSEYNYEESIVILPGADKNKDSASI
jgi:hypothetical protein